MGVDGRAAHDRCVAVVAVTIGAEFEADERPGLARTIAAIAESEPRLTSRPRVALDAALAEARLVVARERHWDHDDVVGFVLAVPCGPLVEAASLWVRPGAGAGVFVGLIAACERVAGRRFLVATFDEAFARYLERGRGYRRISLLRAIVITRGAFLTHRLRSGIRSQVARHVAAARPIVLIGGSPDGAPVDDS